MNLNPGTLGTVSQSACSAQRASLGDQGFPLGTYEEARVCLHEMRSLARSLWPSSLDGPFFGYGTTEILNIVIAGLVGQGVVTVLTSDHEHVGALGSWTDHPRVRTVWASRDELADPQGIALLAASARPSVLLVSQVLYDLCLQMPLTQLVPMLRAHSPHCFIVIDAAQALGLWPPFFEDVDAVVGSLHKWLFGPLGSGLLWLSPRLRQHLGGFRRSGEGLVPADSGAEIGGGCGFSAIHGARAALALYHDVGPRRVLERSTELAQSLRSALAAVFAEHGIATSLSTAGPMFSLAFSGFDPYPLYTELNTRQVHIKCIKRNTRDGAAQNLLRFGVPYYEDTTRLGLVCAHIESYLRRR